MVLSRDGRICFPAACDFDLAVALTPTDLWSHAGIAFLDEESGKPILLHLAGHHALRRHALPAEYALCICPLPSALALQIVTYCELVWHRLGQNGVPYGLSQEGVSFTSDGSVVLAAHATGLTCTTFVLLLFENFGVELVARTMWPARADDEAHHHRLVETLTGRAQPSHIEAVRQQVACARIRPEEAAYAAQLDGAYRPASQADVEGPAAALLRDLSVRFPRAPAPPA